MLRARRSTGWRENELATMGSQHMAMRAHAERHDGPAARRPAGPAAAACRPRPVAVDDARLIAAATDASPELDGCAREVAGAQGRAGTGPDGLTSPTSTRFAGVHRRRVADRWGDADRPDHDSRDQGPDRRGAGDAAGMPRRCSGQTRSDRAASFVAALYVMRNSERQARGVRGRPSCHGRAGAGQRSRQAYAAGTGDVQRI